jgi:hypothetical protein
VKGFENEREADSKKTENKKTLVIDRERREL